MNFEQWFKVIDEGTDMPELMVQQAYEKLENLRKKPDKPNYWAQQLQNFFNNKFPPSSWNVIIGKDFSSEFFHKTGFILSFVIEAEYYGVLFRLY